MKTYKFLLNSAIFGVLAVLLLMVAIPTYADNVNCDGGNWRCYGDSATPSNILKDLRESDDTEVIQTELDNVRRSDGHFSPPELKFSSTLDSVRNHISPYLQWGVFLGLVAAVVFIMINGIRLMFMPLSPDQAAKVKKRMVAVAMGILLVTGFFFIYEVFLSVYAEIFVD